MHFYGPEEIRAHCNAEHQLCTVCEVLGLRLQFYRNFEDLEAHYRSQHFCCTTAICIKNLSYVFAHKSELWAHCISQHGMDLQLADISLRPLPNPPVCSLGIREERNDIYRHTPSIVTPLISEPHFPRFPGTTKSAFNETRENSIKVGVKNVEKINDDGNAGTAEFRRAKVYTDSSSHSTLTSVHTPAFSSASNKSTSSGSVSNSKSVKASEHVPAFLDREILNTHTQVPEFLNRDIISKNSLEAQSRLSQIKRLTSTFSIEIADGISKYIDGAKSLSDLVKEIEDAVGKEISLSIFENISFLQRQKEIRDFLPAYKKQVMFPVFKKIPSEKQPQPKKEVQPLGFKILDFSRKK